MLRVKHKSSTALRRAKKQRFLFSPLQLLAGYQQITHARTHKRTHARTHACTIQSHDARARVRVLFNSADESHFHSSR